MENQVKKPIDRYLLFTIITKFVNNGLMSFSAQKRLMDVLVNTSRENWEEACTIIVHGGLDLSLWQMVSDIDPLFPVEVWELYRPTLYEYMPTNETIILALDEVVCMYSKNLAMSN